MKGFLPVGDHEISKQPLHSVLNLPGKAVDILSRLSVVKLCCQRINRFVLLHHLHGILDAGEGGVAVFAATPASGIAPKR